MSAVTTQPVPSKRFKVFYSVAIGLGVLLFVVLNDASRRETLFFYPKVLGFSLIVLGILGIYSEEKQVSRYLQICLRIIATAIFAAALILGGLAIWTLVQIILYGVW